MNTDEYKKKFSEYFADPLKAYEIEETNKKVLFHYTNITALMNILHTRELHLSRSDFLNDYSELQYTKEIVHEIFVECKNQSKDARKKFFIEKIVNELNKEYVSPDIYILSLTENKDSLILWSNYSNQEGYNLGLNFEKLLTKIFELNGEDYYYGYLKHGKVIYNSEKQKEILNNEIDEIYKKWVELDSKYKRNNIKELILEEALFEIAYKISKYALFFKNSGFKAEEEYRLCFQFYYYNDHCQKQYKIHKGAIVPYIKIPLLNCTEDKCSLFNITIGPKNNIDIAKSGLICFLQDNQYGYMKSRVNKSKIPLRY